MNIFVDLDYTIIGMDGSLRPGTGELFADLVEDGHELYIWSGVGVRWGEVRAAGLERFVRGVYQKPLSDFDAALDRFGVPVVPDFVLDDYPGIVAHFGGVCIRPYLSRQEPDRELYGIRALVVAHHPKRSARHPLVEGAG